MYDAMTEIATQSDLIEIQIHYSLFISDREKTLKYSSTTDFITSLEAKMSEIHNHFITIIILTLACFPAFAIHSIIKITFYQKLY